MRCTICKLELREPEKSCGNAVCKKCLEETVHLSQTITRSANRKYGSTPFADVTYSDIQRSNSERQKSDLQNIKSAQAVARAWRKQNATESVIDTQRKLRFDKGHSAASNSDMRSLSEPISLEGDPTSIASIRNAVSFGVLVFLLGQALMMGAFLGGHFGAWTVGMLFSIGGITVSLLSVNEALRRLDRGMKSNQSNCLQPSRQDQSERRLEKKP